MSTKEELEERGRAKSRERIQIHDRSRVRQQKVQELKNSKLADLAVKFRVEVGMIESEAQERLTEITTDLEHELKDAALRSLAKQIGRNSNEH